MCARIVQLKLGWTTRHCGKARATLLEIDRCTMICARCDNNIVAIFMTDCVAWLIVDNFMSFQSQSGN
jgi:hypothetical protein